MKYLEKAIRAACEFSRDRGSGNLTIFFKDGRWIAIDGLLAFCPVVGKHVDYFDHFAYESLDEALTSVNIMTTCQFLSQCKSAQHPVETVQSPLNEPIAGNPPLGNPS